MKGNNKMVRLLFFFILMLSGITTNAQYRTPNRSAWQRNMTNRANYRNNSIRDMYNQDAQRRRMSETQNKSDERYRNSYEHKNNTETISIREEPKDEVIAPSKKADDISLVVSGEGKTKDEATKQALRSAIEQAFGTFVSAHTEVLHDELIQDEIVSISTGNITGYKEISCVNESNGNKFVTLEATVSIGKLTNFAKSKGMSVELETGAFAMNMKIRELNKKNELQAIKDLKNKILKMSLDNKFFDYNLKISEPYKWGNQYAVTARVDITPNMNLAILWNTIISTLKAISLSPEEQAEYRKANVPFSYYEITDYSNDEEFLNEIQKKAFNRGKKIKLAFRNEDFSKYRYTEFHYEIKSLYPDSLLLLNELQFGIEDNIGNQYTTFYVKEIGGSSTRPSIKSAVGMLNSKKRNIILPRDSSPIYFCTEEFDFNLAASHDYYGIYHSGAYIEIVLSYDPDDFVKIGKIDLVDKKPIIKSVKRTEPEFLDSPYINSINWPVVKYQLLK